jgi:transposase
LLRKAATEPYSETASLRFLKAEIQRLTRCRARQLTRLVGRLRAAPDLARRLDIPINIPGVGDITATTFVIRMPELGRLTRAEAAALVGVAPLMPTTDGSTNPATRRSLAGIDIPRPITEAGSIMAPIPAARYDPIRPH